VLIPLLVCAGVIVANLTFSIYGPELVAAALAERAANVHEHVSSVKSEV
jgi:hypothetical protein